MFRLLATDLDGTLLRSDGTVSDRIRAALAQLAELGVSVVPATARQVRGINLLADQVTFTGWAACSNGSAVVHLTTGELLAEGTIPVPVQRALVDAVRSTIPGAAFFAVRVGSQRYAAELEYQRLTVFSDHKRDPAEFPVVSLDDLVSQPANKIAVRHPTISGGDLMTVIASLDIAGVNVTHSGAPFVDVTAEGISKAWGLEQLRVHLGIAPQETIAFGDELNDVEMLAWAHHAVAMPHSPDPVRSVADEIAASNDDDGMAQVLERLLAEGQFVAAG